ncbi:MAG: hypothetical protein GY822_31560 [Deltaproteobacteria bacterium]|nr:hypothetical protein [Deltaproteobacteria bacterium]
MAEQKQLGLFGASAEKKSESPHRRAPARVLEVVSDRGVVLEKGHQVGRVLWTHGEFFDRVRQLAFLDEGVVRDDAALVLSAVSVLTKGNTWGARIGHDLAALHQTFVNARLTPVEVLNALLKSDERHADLRRPLTQLLEAEHLLHDSGLISSSLAFLRGVEQVERGVLPKVLQGFERIVVHGLVDPSELQVRAVCALAQQGVPLTVRLPSDNEGRGLTQGVQWIKNALEAEYEAPNLELENLPLGDNVPMQDFLDSWYQPQLEPVEVSNVRAEVLQTEGEEARRIAGIVSSWRREGDEPPRIAVCLRTMDRRAIRIADALAQMGVPVRIRRGKPLSQTASGRLLQDLFLLRRDGIPRDRLLSMLANPRFSLKLLPEQVGRVARLLREAVARTDVEDATKPTGGYVHRLRRYLEVLQSSKPEVAARVEERLHHLEEVLAVVYRVDEKASVANYLEVCCQLVQDVMLVDDDGETEKLVEVLETWMQALARLMRTDPEVCQTPCEIPAFMRLLNRILDDEHMPPIPCSDHHGVEFLSLPACAGRHFDYVVIADCVHGHLPRAPQKDPLLSDAERVAINRALGKRALRLQEPDLIEPGPLPPRQALEPLFFASAIASAQRGVLLTCAARNYKGQEQARSEFFQEVMLALSAGADDTEAGVPFLCGPHPRDVQLSLAHHVARVGPLPPRLAEDFSAKVEHVERFARIGRERETFFKSGASPSSSGDYAFAVHPFRLEGVVGHLLGMKSHRPLTPTRLEALAQCRFRGFVEQLLRVDTHHESGQDGDVRVLGTLAHEVMELFYRERRAAKTPTSQMNVDDLKRLQEIVDDCAQTMLEGKSTGHLAALRANIAWLSLALKRTAVMLARNPPVSGVEPSAFEIAVGLKAPEGSEHNYPPVRLPVGSRSLYFGGIIDRVDSSPHARVVIDYKNSTASAIKQKVYAKRIFNEHFQLPLYLRLLEEALPTPPRRELFAYLVSLRDAAISDVLGMGIPLRPRILDDDAEDGLAQGLHRVLTPLLDGTLIPDEGYGCNGCRSARVCRIPRGAFSGATLRILDEENAKPSSNEAPQKNAIEENAQ